MKIAFAGSPPAAAIVLGLLVDDGWDIPVVISQPDRPKGRGGKAVPTPVSIEAERRGLPIVRPQSINDAEVLDALDGMGLAALCVVGFGQILRERILASRPCINVHFSLLPAYRGAAPVERAIMDGLTQTGVTIMQMDAGLDTGPIISAGHAPIGADDDAGVMLERLAQIGGSLLCDALRDLAAGRLVTTPQPEDGVSLAPKIGPDDITFDPALGPKATADRIRALSPHIGVAAWIGGERFKLWRATPAEAATVAPGELRVVDGRLFLPVTGGAVEILEIQPPGRSRMAAADFVRGWRGGLTLGSGPAV